MTTSNKTTKSPSIDVFALAGKKTDAISYYKSYMLLAGKTASEVINEAQLAMGGAFHATAGDPVKFKALGPVARNVTGIMAEDLAPKSKSGALSEYRINGNPARPGEESLVFKACQIVGLVALAADHKSLSSSNLVFVPEMKDGQPVDCVISPDDMTFTVQVPGDDGKNVETQGYLLPKVSADSPSAFSKAVVTKCNEIFKTKSHPSTNGRKALGLDATATNLKIETFAQMVEAIVLHKFSVVTASTSYVLFAESLDAIFDGPAMKENKTAMAWKAFRAGIVPGALVTIK